MRIQFPLEPGSWHGNATERLWAEPVGAGRYRLRNSPFFAFDVSAEDIVFADELEGELIFQGVSLRAGHSTYRIKLRSQPEDLFDKCWAPLQRAGCSYEEGPVLAVDVPPDADIDHVYALLEAGEDAAPHAAMVLEQAASDGVFRVT